MRSSLIFAAFISIFSLCSDSAFAAPKKTAKAATESLCVKDLKVGRNRMLSEKDLASLFEGNLITPAVLTRTYTRDKKTLVILTWKSSPRSRNAFSSYAVELEIPGLPAARIAEFKSTLLRSMNAPQREEYELYVVSDNPDRDADDNFRIVTFENKAKRYAFSTGYRHGMNQIEAATIFNQATSVLKDVLEDAKASDQVSETEVVTAKF